jgi:hypothetical protein
MVCSKEWQEEPGKESCQVSWLSAARRAPGSVKLRPNWRKPTLGVDVVWQGDGGSPGSDGASPYPSQVPRPTT